QEEFQTANDIQWKSAGHLQELARTLRMPSDLLSALREARDQIDQALVKQDEIKEELKQQEDKAKEDLAKKDKEKPKEPEKGLKFPDLQPLPKIPAAAVSAAEKKVQIEKLMQDAVNSEKNAELAKKQAKLA